MDDFNYMSEGSAHWESKPTVKKLCANGPDFKVGI